MKTFAEYQIIGRVGTVMPAGPTLKVSVAADDGRRTDQGEWEGRPSWNTVTFFNESIVWWARDNLGQGDLVHARGTLCETRCDNDGETRYGVTLRRRPVRPPSGERKDMTRGRAAAPASPSLLAAAPRPQPCLDVTRTPA